MNQIKKILNRKLAYLLCSLTILTGCQTAGEHSAAVQQAQQNEDRLTVGTVQRKVSVGMSSADVVGVLGSPNLVSTDEQRREVWVYDKISTNRAYSESASGINILIIGGRSSAGAATTSQRTLTVVIKFDKTNKVRDFAYHTSRF